MERIRKANSRYWKQVLNRVNTPLAMVLIIGRNNISLQSQKWLEKTTPYEPSFAILYWKKSRGRDPVVWAGMKLNYSLQPIL